MLDDRCSLTKCFQATFKPLTKLQKINGSFYHSQYLYIQVDVLFCGFAFHLPVSFPLSIALATLP